MIKDPKYKDGIKDFSVQWLGVNGLRQHGEGPQLRQLRRGHRPVAAQRDAPTFFSNLMSEQGGGKLEALFSSSSSFLDAKLAKLYGVSGVTGDDFKPTTLNPMERAGILTQGAFLAAHSDADYSHPVKRGVHFLHNVVCVDIPSPDGIDVPPLSERKPGQTTRQRYEEATSVNAVCNGCHERIHGAGFALESYDAVGQFRTMEDGKPVDASGYLPLASGRDQLQARRRAEPEGWRHPRGSRVHDQAVPALRAPEVVKCPRRPVRWRAWPRPSGIRSTTCAKWSSPSRRRARSLTVSPSRGRVSKNVQQVGYRSP